MNVGYVSVPSSDGDRFDAYVASPGDGPAPAIIVFHELFGINDNMRSLAARLAKLGYLAVVPDMFWRVHPRFESKDESGTADGLAIASKVDLNLAVDDMRATLEYLLQRSDCNQNVGGLGFCFGGTLAYLFASKVTAGDVKPVGVVSYYGFIFDAPNTAANVPCPMLFHFGIDDPHIPVEHARDVAAAFADRGDVRVELYEAGHAFSNWDAPSLYQEASAELAWDRTSQFLKENVR